MSIPTLANAAIVVVIVVCYLVLRLGLAGVGPVGRRPVQSTSAD
jgi:hypothetical protein